MFFNVILAFVVATPFLCVQAQSSASSAAAALPTSLGSLPPCVLNCTTTAATQAGCTSVTDLTCVCTSQKFQANALACLKADCSASDQQVASGLQSAICGSVSASGTASGSGSASHSGSATASGSGSAAASNASGTAPASSASGTASAASQSASSAASGLNKGLGVGHVIGLVAVLAGVLTGTVL